MEQNEAENKLSLLEYRMEKLETKFDEMAKGVNEIRDTLNRLVVTNTGITQTNCLLHNKRMSDLEESNKELTSRIEGINKKIITWTAIASVILFLVSQLVIPYVLQNVKVSTNPPVATLHSSYSATNSVGYIK